MAILEQIVARQSAGSRFVISAVQLGLSVAAFDALVQRWLEDGAPGFEMAAVPHRKCIDGEFFIDRVTVRRLA